MPYTRLDSLSSTVQTALQRLLPAGSHVSEWYVEFDDCQFTEMRHSNFLGYTSRVRLVYSGGLLKYASHRGSAFRYDPLELKLGKRAADFKLRILEEDSIPVQFRTVINDVQREEPFMTVKCKAGSGVANARKSDAFKRAATRWVRLDWKQIVELRERQKTQKIGKEITEATYYKREIGENVADNTASDDDDDAVLNLI